MADFLLVEASEKDPLLPQTTVTTRTPPSSTTAVSSSCSILVDIIGATHLPAIDHGASTYCVIHYGTKVIHRTLPYQTETSVTGNKARLLHRLVRRRHSTKDDPTRRALANPIWTILHNSLVNLTITPKDLRNRKPLMISLWAKTPTTRSNYAFVGKVKLAIADLLLVQEQKPGCCFSSNQRIELPLLDRLDRPIVNNDKEKRPSFLALRWRVATRADQHLVQQWNEGVRPKPPYMQYSVTATAPQQSSSLFSKGKQKKDLWRHSHVVSPAVWDRPIATCVTELPERAVEGASFTTSVAQHGKNAVVLPIGKIRVKPYPNPATKEPFWTLQQCKVACELPSTNWVRADYHDSWSSTLTSSEKTETAPQHAPLGSLKVEVLSARDLPNVDLGGYVGNVTDAFCNIIYGDVMVQTDVIDDELSPHWPPWSQRAFQFSIQHPHHALYLAVFGFKRKPLLHKPIGRIQINLLSLQPLTRYILEYPLATSNKLSSRSNDPRQQQPRIRLRLQLDIPDARRFLLASVLPPPLAPPAPYLNCHGKKTLAVARYTVQSYDQDDSFRLQVFQGYLEEILDVYLKGIIYALQDGVSSLVFWRGQITICNMDWPVYSLLLFITCLWAVEHPQHLPSCICFGLALLLWSQVNRRSVSPSPWRRTFGFAHFLQVLLWGKGGVVPDIEPYEGSLETQALDASLAERRQREDALGQHRENLEKEIEDMEAGNTMKTKSKTVTLEILTVLGKVQGILGAVCRILRLMESILTWEANHLSFFLTLGLLLLGLAFLAVPWGHCLHWIGRIGVVLFLGPQNMLINYWLSSSSHEDPNHHNLPENERLRRVFAGRLQDARCQQEEIVKLKAYRHVLFGEFSTLAPSSLSTGPPDIPLPSSHSAALGEKESSMMATNGGPASEDASGPSTTSLAVRQHIDGKIIPRAPSEWHHNEDISKEMEQSVLKDLFLGLNNTEKLGRDSIASGPLDIEQGGIEGTSESHQGFEITDLYEEEAGFVDNLPVYESIRELGIEVVAPANCSDSNEVDDTEPPQYFQAFRSDDDLPLEDDCDSEPSDTSAPGSEKANVAANSPNRETPQAGNRCQSYVEAGIEGSDLIGNEQDVATNAPEKEAPGSESRRQSYFETGIEVSDLVGILSDKDMR